MNRVSLTRQMMQRLCSHPKLRVNSRMVLTKHVHVLMNTDQLFAKLGCVKKPFSLADLSDVAASDGVLVRGTRYSCTSTIANYGTARTHVATVDEAYWKNAGRTTASEMDRVSPPRARWEHYRHSDEATYQCVHSVRIDQKIATPTNDTARVSLVGVKENASHQQEAVISARPP